MTRLEKKKQSRSKDLELALEWHQDLRGALLETIFENNDVRIIKRQFKHKFTKGDRRKRNHYLKRTLMCKYCSIALD